MILRKIYILTIFILSAYTGFAQENIHSINIIHWNDFHSRNIPYEISRKKDGETVKYYIGGTGGVLGYINKLKDENSLFLHGGDDFQGSPISSITKGFSQIELLNLFPLDAFVVGNHEFDYGAVSLDSALKNAHFDVLSANLKNKESNITFGKQYIIKEKNGVKVGIIGVSPTDLSTLTLPKNIETIEILNTDSVISVNLKTLKDEKCDLIVLLSHNGIEADREFAKKFYGDLDVIIGGHSHTPVFKPEIVDGVYICQAGSYGKYVGKLDLKVDVDKDTVIYAFGKLTETVLDSTVFDKAAGEKVDMMISSIEPEMKKVIGILETDWKKNNAGQWSVDAMREALNTDIAFLNGGSIRKDLLKGNITVGDIWEISPFGNNIMTFNIKGNTLKKMIANNVRKSMKDKELNDYDMALFSGFTVKLNSSNITDDNDDFIISIDVNGKPLEEEKSYSVVTNSYTASQMEKYFGDFGEEIYPYDTNIIDRDLFLEAVQKQKVINNVYEKRIFDINK